jgi:hypothetical protein
MSVSREFYLVQLTAVYRKTWQPNQKKAECDIYIKNMTSVVHVQREFKRALNTKRAWYLHISRNNFTVMSVNLIPLFLVEHWQSQHLWLASLWLIRLPMPLNCLYLCRMVSDNEVLLLNSLLVWHFTHSSYVLPSIGSSSCLSMHCCHLY